MHNMNLLFHILHKLFLLPEMNVLITYMKNKFVWALRGRGVQSRINLVLENIVNKTSKIMLKVFKSNTFLIYMHKQCGYTLDLIKCAITPLFSSIKSF